MRGDSELWTAAAVKARLEDAAESLRRLRAARHTFPAGFISGWPDVVQDTWDAYGFTAPRLRPPAPSARAIDRMDEAVGWIDRVGDEAEIRRLVERHRHGREHAEEVVIARRKIVWARACRIPWRRLEDIDGRSHTTLRKIQAEGLEAILRWLNDGCGTARAEAVFRPQTTVAKK